MAGEEDLRADLVEALEEAASSEGSQYLLADLHGLAMQSPEGRVAWNDWRLKDQTELDLHIEGPTVDDHATRADRLGLFMRRSADAVKEIAKDIGGLNRHAPNLQVLAPAAGSVRVVFLTSRHAGTSKDVSPPIAGTEASTLDSMALHRLASLMAQAADPDLSLLQGSVDELNGRARTAVRLLASTILESAWTLDGTIAARGEGQQRVRLDLNAAARLQTATAVASSSVIDTPPMRGEIDGWIWSKSALRFLPDGAAPFQATVPPRLQEEVARINGDPEHRAMAIFTVTATYAPGDAGHSTRSYVLKEVRQIHEQPELPATS